MNIKGHLHTIGFRSKITASIIAILLLLGIGLSLVMNRLVSQALLSESKVRGTSGAVNLAARVAEPMLSIDFLQLKNMVDEAVKTGKDTSYAFVLDKEGRPLVHTFAGGFPVDLKGVNNVADTEPYHVRSLTTGAELLYDFAAPVFIGKERLGTVRIGMSLNRVQTVVNKLMLAILFSLSIGILIVGLVSTGLARTVTRKIQLLHRAAEEIIKGNLDVQTAPLLRHRCWEIMKCDKMTCPAHRDEKRRCWYLVGTMCPACAQGRYAEKIESCKECPVYRLSSGDEIQHLAEFFDIMALTLKQRMEALEETERSLRHQQQIFQTILDVTPDMVTLKDRDLRYRAVNKAFCVFLGRTEDEIIGNSDVGLLPAEQAEASRRGDREVLESGRPVRAEKEVRWQDSGHGTRWLHIIKTAVVNPQGEVIGLLSTSRDITEMKELHDRVARSQRMESLGQLAAGVAHEINTPLGIILGYAQLSLEDVPKETELHAHLETIEKYARICKTVVADLLRFSRHTESVKKPLDINQIVNQVVGVVEHMFGLERITLARNLAPELPLIFGDQEKLEQVLINLLNNAYDAIESDGVVTVSTTYDGIEKEVVIEVADTGRGVPAEIKDRVFEPFFTTKGVGKGTGLGLSVTFGIIKDHGGKIDLVSPYLQTRVGGSLAGQRGGTAFIIRLPTHVTNKEDKGGV